MKKTNFSNFSDEILTSLAANDDKNAMDFLLDKHRPLVRAIARGFFLLGGDSDDVLQEGMIGLFKAIRDFDSSKNVSFVAFARVCIKRQIMSAVKTANRNKNKPLNNALSFEQSESSPYGFVANPETILIEKEDVNLFTRQICEKLSSFEQKVLALYLQGKSYTEISQDLKKEPKSIDNAIQRIKRKLAPLM